MFCVKCGNKNAEGSAFCHKCGAKMVAVDATPQASGVQIPDQVSSTQAPVAPTDVDVSSLLAKLPTPKNDLLVSTWELPAHAVVNRENCLKCSSGDVVPIVLRMTGKAENATSKLENYFLCKACGHHFKAAQDEYKSGMTWVAIMGILGVLLVPVGILLLGGIGGLISILIGLACLAVGVKKLLDALKAKARINGTAPQGVSPKKNNMGKLIGGAITIVIVVALAFGINALFSGGGYDSSIQMVRNGSPHAFPNTTWGEAVDNFMVNPRWNSLTGIGGEDLVEVRGMISYAGEDVEALLQFTLDRRTDSFEINYISFDGVSQPLLMAIELVNVMFGELEHGITGTPPSVANQPPNIGNPALVGTWDWNEHWPGVEGAIVLHEDGRYSWQGTDYGALGYRWSSHMGVVYSTLNDVTTAWFSYQFITDDILLIFYATAPGVGYRLDRAGARDSAEQGAETVSGDVASQLVGTWVLDSRALWHRDVYHFQQSTHLYFNTNGTGVETEDLGGAHFEWFLTASDYSASGYMLDLDYGGWFNRFRIQEITSSRLVLYEAGQSNTYTFVRSDGANTPAQPPVSIHAEQVDLEFALVGTWTVSAFNDHERYNRIGATVTFSSDRTGFDSYGGNTWNFSWQVVIIDDWLEDYLELRMEFDNFTIYSVFPRVENNTLVLSDWTGEQWAELTRN